jgi:hypothetical protein
MSEPRPRRCQQPYGYGYRAPNPHPQAHPQSPLVPTQRVDHFAPWSSCPTPNGAGDQRLFQVRATKPTGLVMAWYNQRYTITGTFARCEAAISDAQQHNLLAG